MSEWAISVIQEVLKWAVAFTLGFLFRKRTGRAITRAKRWLMNDVVPVTIISVRVYVSEEAPAELDELTRKFYDDVSARITNPMLHDVFSAGIRIEIPVFGILRLNLGRIDDQEDEQDREETSDRIKVTLQPETSVRLGAREINLLHDYAHTAEILFNATEGLMRTRKSLKQNYSVIEFPRLGRFVEERSFEIDDKDLGTHVHATANKLTLTVSPTSQIAKATAKYLLV